MARRIPRRFPDHVPPRGPRHAVDPTDRTAHVLAGIARDREGGTVLWQLVVDVGEAETRAALTAEPEAFVARLHADHVDVDLVLPLTLADAADAGITALPHDHLFTAAEAIAHGVAIEVVPAERWAVEGWR